MPLANPWVLLVLLVTLIAASAGGAKLGYNYAEGKHAREEVLIQQAGEAAQRSAADEIAKIKIVHQTNQTRLEREIVKVPDFSQCHAGADALRVLNGALTGQAGTEPAGGGVVPKADGTDR